MGAGASNYFTSYTDLRWGFLDDVLPAPKLHEFAAKGDYNQVSIWMKYGISPNAVRSSEQDEFDRQDTLAICTARGYYSVKGLPIHIKTLEVLYKFGADLNKVNRFHQSPLYIACDRNLLLIVEWLLEKKVDVNIITKTGDSAILCAYRNGNAALIDSLLKAGARVTNRPKRFSCAKFPALLPLIDQDIIKQKENKEKHVMTDTVIQSPFTIEELSIIREKIESVKELEEQKLALYNKQVQDKALVREQQMYHEKVQQQFALNAPPTIQRRRRRIGKKELEILNQYKQASISSIIASKKNERNHFAIQDSELDWVKVHIGGQRPTWKSKPHLRELNTNSKPLTIDLSDQQCQQLYDRLEQQHRLQRQRMQTAQDQLSALLNIPPSQCT